MKLELKITFEDGTSFCLPTELVNVQHAIGWVSQHYNDVSFELVKVKK